MAKLNVRIEFGDEDAVGPGKIRLLELIESSGSIAAAGRDMGMSYRRAWLLIDEVNRCFRKPVVEKRTVPKERVALRKDVTTEERQVSEQVRKEQIEPEGDQL